MTPREKAIRKINDQIFILCDKITIGFSMAQSYAHGLIEMAVIGELITQDEAFDLTNAVYCALAKYRERTR
jgi:hypothetical protein